MEAKMERGRSPSVPQGLNPSSSPHFQQENVVGLSPAMTYNTSNYNSSSASTDPYHYNSAFMNATAQSTPYQNGMASNGFPPQELDSAFKRSISNGPPRPQHLTLQNSNHQFPSEYHTDPSPGYVDQFTGQDLGVKQDSGYHNLFMLDPSLQSNPPPPQSINPQDVMARMSPQQNHLPTPTNLTGVDARLSPTQSPSSRQPQYQSPNHSRNASGSLAPSSAGYVQGHQPADWTNVIGAQAFQQHRRAPSEHSDFSSVGPSPFLAQQESFDAFDQSHSPLLAAQGESSLYQDSLGIEKFSISDQQQRQGLSPGHSPYPSPRMSPRGSFNMPPESSFVLPSNDLIRPSAVMFEQHEQFHDFRPDPYDMGQATQMAPPEINVELAPPSRPTVESSLSNHDALSPPEGRRGRLRAKSDPSLTPISRPLTPADASPALAALDRHRSLSPFEGSSLTPYYGRESSPAGYGGKSSSRRSSTSSIPNRDYILELADPSRPSASGDNRQRVQKHPATFQCTLCPKRFTRAYNLRSHLRTHTDERPFVCTVCGKAFARQHDRKRHEGLHSGEKKFICRGELGSGGSWGCGRRFARADALGRHFRSEAGRVCIKPLLDEEALERQRLIGEQMLAAPGMMNPAGLSPHHPMDVGGGGFALPAALLAQYPALQDIQWGTPMASGQDGDEAAEAPMESGEGWMEEEEGTTDGYVSSNGMGYGGVYGQGDWASDYERGRS